MNEQEKTADIIAEMRRGFDQSWHDIDREWAHGLADRLEAALRREKAAIEADALEVGGLVGASCKREMSKIASKNGADFGQLGDCAKLREVLSDACYAMFNFLKTQNGGYEEMSNALDKAKAALAAPPRNCDVYNSESCRMAYHLHGDGLMTMQAFADWLFAPATEKEGGVK